MSVIHGNCSNFQKNVEVVEADHGIFLVLLITKHGVHAFPSISCLTELVGHALAVERIVHERVHKASDLKK